MITIYGRKGCSTCKKATKACEDAKVAYVYIDMASDAKIIFTLMEKIGRVRTIPQIFDNDNHIGGYSNLIDHLNG